MTDTTDATRLDTPASTRGAAPGPVDPTAAEPHAGGAQAIERELVQLLALDRELAELAYVRRADALERVADVVRDLGELPAGEELPVRAAAEFGAASEFRRVLISEVSGDRLIAVAAWDRDGAGDRLVAALDPFALAYPQPEREVVRDRTPRIVDAGVSGRTAHPWTRSLRWRAYAVAPLVADPETIGLVHADAGDRELDELDREVIGQFAAGLSGLLERAVLRHTLELHRAELSAASQWLARAVRRLDDLAGATASDALLAAEARALQSLTGREAEVLRLLARGLTNREIARRLVVREGTVKYHVKNILRKLGAEGRADAVSRYLRATAGEART